MHPYSSGGEYLGTLNWSEFTGWIKEVKGQWKPNSKILLQIPREKGRGVESHNRKERSNASKPLRMEQGFATWISWRKVCYEGFINNEKSKLQARVKFSNSTMGKKQKSQDLQFSLSPNYCTS